MTRFRHIARALAMAVSALLVVSLTLVLPAHAAAGHHDGPDACATCHVLAAQAPPLPPPAMAWPPATSWVRRSPAPRVAPSIPTRTPGPVRGPPCVA